MFSLFKPLAKAVLPSTRTALDGTTLFVPGDAAPIPVVVTVRPQARRMLLRIDRRTGGASLTLPRGIGRVRAERFLETYAGWLRAKINALPARIMFEDGSLIPIRGVPHRIVHRLPFRGETRLVEEGGENLLIVHGDPAHIASRVMRFLRALALEDLERASRLRAGQLNVTLGKITIKDTRSRWGSCAARGDLSFSWRLILAPPFVLDYLAAHEVAHRLEMNHSMRYWRHVRFLCPDFESAERWLKQHGPSLHHYG